MNAVQTWGWISNEEKNIYPSFNVHQRFSFHYFLTFTLTSFLIFSSKASKMMSAFTHLVASEWAQGWGGGRWNDRVSLPSEAEICKDPWEANWGPCDHSTSKWKSCLRVKNSDLLRWNLFTKKTLLLLFQPKKWRWDILLFFKSFYFAIVLRLGWVCLGRVKYWTFYTKLPFGCSSQTS